VAGDIAIGVRSLSLDKDLHATLDHLRSSMNSTVEAIASMVELRDPYTAGHERRVAQLTCAIGKEMGLPERQIEGLHVIGYLHDIGKIAVPAEILSKPARLTEIELAMVRSHAQSGYDILKNLEFPWPVAQAVLQHHERLDGSGYPQGLAVHDIILEARILMVADVVEAMASHRPYRTAIGLKAALAEITANRGSLYDEGVVDTCVRLFAEKGFKFEG
jgi:putative nucleotidyltransferase with HDIG domain